MSAPNQQQESGKSKRFSPADIANLTLLSQLHFDKSQTLTQLQEAKDSAEVPTQVKLEKRIQLASTLNDISRFLSMYGENNAAPRILQKEAMPQFLNELVSLQKGYHRQRDERLKHVVNPENEEDAEDSKK